MIKDQGGALYLRKCAGIPTVESGVCVNKIWWDKNAGSIKEAIQKLPTLDKGVDLQLTFFTISSGLSNSFLEKQIVDLGGKVYMRKKIIDKKYQHVVMCVSKLWWEKHNIKIVTT